MNAITAQRRLYSIAKFADGSHPIEFEILNTQVVVDMLEHVPEFIAGQKSMFAMFGRKRLDFNDVLLTLEEIGIGREGCSSHIKVYAINSLDFSPEIVCEIDVQTHPLSKSVGFPVESQLSEVVIYFGGSEHALRFMFGPAETAYEITKMANQAFNALKVAGSQGGDLLMCNVKNMADTSLPICLHPSCGYRFKHGGKYRFYPILTSDHPQNNI